MPDLTGVTHHPAIAEIVEVLCRKTENTDKGFFRVEMAYFLAKAASCMRAAIVTKDRGEIPINMYALALATSGYGKGHSVHIIENDVLMPFKKRFMSETMPLIAEKNMWDIALDRAARKQVGEQEEFERVCAEYARTGTYPFTFDSGTSPAVKQLRTKLLLAGCGSINLQIDEIGSNLVDNKEVLNTFLELYDQGMVKQKLTKNTNESVRSEELDGKTPTNMLLFGTPSKLLDGGTVEDQFYSFLDTGYARRCIFAFGQQGEKAYHTQSPAEIYNNQIKPSNSKALSKWADVFYELADPAKFGWRIELPDEVAIALVAYRCECSELAEQMADHEEIRKAEISHRYFKALKLAGAFAFVDSASHITMSHLKQAMLLVEESGIEFQRLLTREKAYMKLAKYIAAVQGSVTHTDLQEALPFYKSGAAYRNDLMTLATAWGYRQHILIKKTFVDGIEFFTGETLKETKLDEVTLSYSDHVAYNFQGEKVPFSELYQLTQSSGQHWCNHFMHQGHRAEQNAIEGFNLVVLDIDEGTSVNMCRALMQDYTYLIYTTKRSTDENNRFRLILPINYILQMGKAEYEEFMENIIRWLPFAVDEGTSQRSRKWESCATGTYHYNDGTLLDVLPFIPRTRKNEDLKAQEIQLQSLDNLERWFAKRIADGNRNNQMLKFALALVDSGQSLIEVQDNVHAFNKKLANGLPESEITNTILTTVAKRYKVS